jgi:hypothetical protein
MADLRNLARAIVDRLATPTFKPPASLTADAKAFKSAATAFETAATKADAARGARDDQLVKVGDADAALDRSLDDLADAIVGAKLGKRSEPFAAFSKLSPSRMKELAYKKEVDAVAALLKAVDKSKPPKSVASVALAVKKNAARVSGELGALTGPAAASERALAARDALLPGLAKALGRFKIRAKAAWVDEPDKFKALFAPPTAVQAPKRPRKAKPAPPPPPQPPPPAAPPAPAAPPTAPST